MQAAGRQAWSIRRLAAHVQQLAAFWRCLEPQTARSPSAQRFHALHRAVHRCGTASGHNRRVRYRRDRGSSGATAALAAVAIYEIEPVADESHPTAEERGTAPNGDPSSQHKHRGRPARGEPRRAGPPRRTGRGRLRGVRAAWTATTALVAPTAAADATTGENFATNGNSRSRVARSATIAFLGGTTRARLWCFVAAATTIVVASVAAVVFTAPVASSAQTDTADECVQDLGTLDAATASASGSGIIARDSGCVSSQRDPDDAASTYGRVVHH